MKVTPEYVKAMAEAQGLPIPDDELENVRHRLTTWMAAMEQIELELGEQMNELDPIPPVEIG